MSYLHEDRSLLTAVLDIYDCRKVLREQGEPHRWRDAWQLHRVRIAAHHWVQSLKQRGDS